MTAAPTTRMAAEDRRLEIIEAAREEFALRGLHGASTDAIARRAGISQPYLFRLFGTKKELYLAAVRQCLADTLSVFQDVTAGKAGEEALDAIGHAYGELVRENPTVLLAQMQGYAACSDPEVREVVREGYGRLVEHAERVSGADPARIAAFFGGGMLLNVIAAMGLVDAEEGWAQRLLQGCREGISEA
jgi:AcrR family transcriptional regulator